MRDDYIHLAGLCRYVLCDSPELLRVLERAPIPGQREIRNHHGIANMVHGVAPEIRTPLCAVKAQALDLGRVVVEIMKSLLPGLAEVPATENIFVDSEGNITGLV